VYKQLHTNPLKCAKALPSHKLSNNHNTFKNFSTSQFPTSQWPSLDLPLVLNCINFLASSLAFMPYFKSAFNRTHVGFTRPCKMHRKTVRWDWRWMRWRLAQNRCMKLCWLQKRRIKVGKKRLLRHWYLKLDLETADFAREEQIGVAVEAMLKYQTADIMKSLTKTN